MSRSHLARVTSTVVGLALLCSFFAVTSGASAASKPRVDPALARQLARSGPAERLAVFVHGRDIRSAIGASRAAGLRVVNRFDRVGIAVASGTPAQIQTLRGSPRVTYLEADAPIQYFLNTSNEATRGEELYQGYDVQYEEKQPRDCKRRPGKKRKCKRPPPVTKTKTIQADGTGANVAIIDSGVDGTHPMFQQDGKSKVVRNLKLACHDIFCPGANGSPEAQDPFWVDVTNAGNDSDTPSAGGHGTHVAGIAAGVPVTTVDGKEMHGAAPGAKIVSLSIGQLLSIYGGTSGMNWVLENHAAPCGDGADPAVCPPIKVVNNSWGRVGGGDFDPESAVVKIQDALVDEGVTVVWAAGNGDAVNDGGDGSDNRVNPPAQDPKPGIIGVANYDDGNTASRDNGLNSSSSRGKSGSPATYPDISAPGTDITAACRPQLAVCYSGLDTADPNYNTIGGTSMAAPHIAGIVAQLLELNPALTPAAIEDALEDTAHKFSFGAPYEDDPRNPDDTTSFDKGHGLVDVVGAASSLLGYTGPPAAAQCTNPAGPVVVDSPDDATNILVGTPLPSEPSLDVVEGRVDWDATAGAVTFTIKVKDLTAEDPAGTVGLYFDYNFTYEGGAYYIAAERNRVDGASSGKAESFALGHFAPTRTTIASGLPGTFDVDGDVVVVTVANSALAGKPISAFEDGDVLSNFSIDSRRNMHLVVPNADTANGICPYTLGLGAVPPTEPPPPPPVEEPDAELSTQSPEYSWTGGPYFAISGLFNLFGCDDLIFGQVCDIKRLDVTVPDGGATLSASISAELDPVNDFDLYLYDPDGKQIDSSGNPGSAEAVSANVTESGIYTVVVRAFNTLEAEYEGQATLGAPADG